MPTDDARLLLGDCLDRMREIADGQIDLVLADLPYGVTSCRWDVVIPFEPLWAHYKRVLKPRGAVVLTACQPFTSMLVMSHPKWFRYSLVWDKATTTGYLDAKRKPLRAHEDITLFSPRGVTTYHPEMWEGEPNHGRLAKSAMVCSIYGAHSQTLLDQSGTKYPRSILRFPAVGPSLRLHPAEKPVALMEYLIRTYSNPGDLVLDNSMGSGTTVVAAINTDRRVIGIEKDPDIFATAEARIAAHQSSTPLLAGVS